MNVKILVVDDDKQTASSIGRYLNSCGYSADYECNPLQALKKIEDDNFLIVISDIVMKPMSGIEFAQKHKRV